MERGWTISDMGEDGIHILPVEEVDADGKSLHMTEGCTCGVIWDSDGVWVHMAFDGREKFENGERKTS